MSAINTIFDGSIPLVTVELAFDETTALTRMDMEGARTRINNGVDKGFVAASNMKSSITQTSDTNVKTTT